MTYTQAELERSPSLRPLGPMPSGFAPCGCRQYWDEERRTVVAACELRCAAQKCTRRVRRKKE